MIKEIKANEIPGRKAPFNNMVMNEVKEFHENGWEACEVDTAHYKTAHSAYAAYHNAIKRLRVGVIALERNGRLFLVRGK